MYFIASSWFLVEIVTLKTNGGTMKSTSRRSTTERRPRSGPPSPADDAQARDAAHPQERASRKTHLKLSLRTNTSTDAQGRGHFRIASRKRASARRRSTRSDLVQRGHLMGAGGDDSFHAKGGADSRT